MTYASQTTVTVEKSRNEIERTLVRYGADKFGYGYDQAKAIIQFEAQGRHVRFTLPLPSRDDQAFTHYRRSKYDSFERRTPAEAEKRWEQACRQKWRALSLVVKAKLEAVEAGIVTFEDEFMAQIVLPNGSTVGEFMTPQIEAAYSSGGMPALLPGR